MGKKFSFVLVLNKEKHNLGIEVVVLFQIVSNPSLSENIWNPIQQHMFTFKKYPPYHLVYVEFIGQEEEVLDPLHKGWDP